MVQDPSRSYNGIVTMVLYRVYIFVHIRNLQDTCVECAPFSSLDFAFSTLVGTSPEVISTKCAWNADAAQAPSSMHFLHFSMHFLPPSLGFSPF